VISIKYFACAMLVALALGVAGLTLPAPSNNTYNVVDFGAVGDDDGNKAAQNTTAIAAAIAAASDPANPGTVYFPPSKGAYVVTNGVLSIDAACLNIKGAATMGSRVEWGPTSTLAGKGPGDTLKVTQGGGSVSGLEFKPFDDAQRGTDAFLHVTNTATAVTISDIHMWAPNIGIQLETSGQGWIKDVLIEGQIKYAGIVADAGNTTVSIQHVIMYSWPSQPPYGVLIKSAGELIMEGGCDLISCGNCLAIQPGFGGARGQQVNAVFVSNCLFDSGNGQGACLICPQTDGYVFLCKFTNCWASTENNLSGTNPTNGFTIDGSQTHPPLGIRPIQDVTFTNCSSRNFVRHCGWYCKNAYGVTWSGCMASGNFVGIQTYGTTGIISASKCGDFSPGPLNYPAGNAAYGILLEKSLMAVSNDNLLMGNGRGGIIILP
jgi:hypothetical protein